jgi:hypothetical protein
MFGSKKMNEKKLTDEEIVKAYIHCVLRRGDCDNCPYDEVGCGVDGNDLVEIINRQKAEIERLTEEIKSIKELTAEQVIESEKLKQSCAEAVNSFVRLETLYKIKCQELEIANKKLEDLKGGKID